MFKPTSPLPRGDASSRYLRATALARGANPELAISCYREAIALEPTLVSAWLGLGHVLKVIGEQDAAIVAYREAKTLSPHAGEIDYSLSNLKTFVFEEEEIAEMQQRMDSGQLGTRTSVYLAFSLGKAFEDAGDYDRAFAYYRRGNQIHRDTISYNTLQTKRINARIRDTFSPELMAKFTASSRGCQDPAPIFILGLPRSGSTLLEQILSSHSEVDGTGELPELSAISRSLADQGHGVSYPEVTPDLPTKQLIRLGQSYITRTRRHRRQGRYFTDKMPNNFAHIGLLHLILPRAKIIDARRHPLDTCLGCFGQHFTSGQAFSYKLRELGDFYLEYRRMMGHWETVLPGKVLQVQYEDVVAGLETQVRRILNFCELPFEEACVNFHRTDRPVRTASSQQVRKPIYASSVNRWQRFEKQLRPLAHMLRPVLPEHGERG